MTSTDRVPTCSDGSHLPAALLWDMDGTLVDTEPYWMAEEYALVEGAGGTWTQGDALDLVGNDLITSARIILARTPVQGSPEQVVDRLLAGVVRRCRERMPWRPGAQSLLAQAQRLGVPQALVTMSWTALAQVLVEGLPAGTFTTVVTGDQVRHGKPHPEPYLEAARRLGIAPGACLAVEDSPTGATSSTAAGVPTVVVPSVVPVPAMAGAVQLRTLDGLELGELAAAVRAA